jgi:hypothetical protein
MSGTIYYKIYASYPDDWTTIEQVETSGTLKLDYTSNISSYTITGLERRPAWRRWQRLG